MSTKEILTGRVEMAATLLSVLAAVSIAAVVLKREFSSAPGRAASEATSTESDWQTLAEFGNRIGAPNAAVTLTVVSDLECPFCADFHHRVRKLMRLHPKQLSLNFVHFPLPGHRRSRDAATAAECAGKQGRFAEMLDHLFVNRSQWTARDDDDTAGWARDAHKVGVLDTSAFRGCLSSPEPMARIERSFQLGLTRKIMGTPTVLINGTRYRSPPDDSVVLSEILMAVR